jgi:hypothetical protein
MRDLPETFLVRSEVERGIASIFVVAAAPDERIE